jgi:hypothetical protein
MPSGVFRAQENRDGFAGRRLVDMDRHEAAVVVMRIEQGELLLAVGPVLGVVDIEHDAPGYGIETVAEQLHHRCHHTLERDRAGQVLKPRHGRLRAEISAGLGQAADRHFEGRVLPQQIAIIGVRIARRDSERAEPDHLCQPMDNPVRRARIFNAAGQTFGDSQPPLHFGQKQNAAIRRQPPAIKTGDDGLAADR